MRRGWSDVQEKPLWQKHDEFHEAQSWTKNRGVGKSYVLQPSLLVEVKCRTTGNLDLLQQTLGTVVEQQPCLLGKWWTWASSNPSNNSSGFQYSWNTLWCGEMISITWMHWSWCSKGLVSAGRCRRLDPWLAKALVWDNTALLIFMLLTHLFMHNQYEM